MKFPFLNKFSSCKSEHWKKYCHLFRKKKKQSISETRFILFDTETTGFDYKNDRILCIGAVVVINGRIIVKDNLEIYLNQDVFNPSTVEIHGILKSEKVEKIEEKEALEQFLEYIKDSVLVAHHTAFDVGMINAALKRNGFKKLKNKSLDTETLFTRSKHIVNIIDPNKRYSLDEISSELKISVKDRHTAAGDAYITAIAFLKILAKLNKDGKMKFKDLFLKPMIRY
jgi:DNA polymerase-3 subunit epsilon